MRRQPATAFCASFSTSVAVCSGETNSVTRNRNATSSPCVMSPDSPSRTPSRTMPAMASAATISVSGKTKPTMVCALVWAFLLASTAWSTRSAVRRSEA